MLFKHRFYRPPANYPLHIPNSPLHPKPPRLPKTLFFRKFVADNKVLSYKLYSLLSAPYIDKYLLNPYSSRHGKK